MVNSYVNEYAYMIKLPFCEHLNYQVISSKIHAYSMKNTTPLKAEIG